MLRALKTPRTLSPAREALAAAIGYHAERQSEIAAANKALDAAIAAWRTARDARDAAARVLEGARDAATTFLIAKANGTAGTAPVSIHEARASLERAESDLVAAGEVKEALEDKATDLQRYADVRDDKVASAAAAAMRDEPAVLALVADVLRLQSELVEKGAALMFLVGNGAVHLDNVPTPRGSEFSPARKAVARLDQMPRAWPEMANYQNMPSIVPWRAALEALRHDAAAELPKG